MNGQKFSRIFAVNANFSLRSEKETPHSLRSCGEDVIFVRGSSPQTNFKKDVNFLISNGVDEQGVFC